MSGQLGQGAQVTYHQIKIFLLSFKPYIGSVDKPIVIGKPAGAALILRANSQSQNAFINTILARIVHHTDT
jgi:hypothetical protein